MIENELGYTGTECTLDINECIKNPCNHNATCQNTYGSYSCHCQAGFTGKKCETNINDCINNECQNGATCVDLIASYQCDCARGYTGMPRWFDI